MKPIIMEIVARIKDNKDYDIESMTCIWDGFEFKYQNNHADDISIKFDFDSWSTKFKRRDGYIYIDSTSGEGNLFKDYLISEDYIMDMINSGIDPNILTASFMSSATNIVEVNCDINCKLNNTLKIDQIDSTIEIVSISFTGESLIPLYINSAVIDNFNKINRQS